MNPSSTTALFDRSKKSGVMRAVGIENYGPPQALSMREVPRPQCGDQQMLVRVRAAGVNPIDWRIRDGSLRLLLPAKFPLVLGYDVAGEVVETRIIDRIRGEHWEIGDEVYCFLDNRHGGGYAEYAVVGADAVSRKPTTISFVEAAATPLASLTALQALRDLGKLKPGDEVLVNGASGGVGTFAVQVAVALGATVTGVCSEHGAQLARELGAQKVIDYKRDDFTKGAERYDIVFDAVGKSSYRRCRRVLKRGGSYVTTLPSASNIVSLMTAWIWGHRCSIILVRPRGTDLDVISRMIEAKEVRPVVQSVYSLEDAAAAHELSEAGHVQGKVVLSVAPK